MVLTSGGQRGKEEEVVLGSRGQGGKEGKAWLGSAGERVREGEAVLDSGDQRVKEEVVPTTPSVETSRQRAKKSLQAAAREIAAEPLRLSDPSAWGVLEPISTKARSFFREKHIVLKADENVLGRAAVGSVFHCDSPTISGRHCKIFKKKVEISVPEATNNPIFAVYIKDTSTNGTYVNWELLKKNAPHVELHHGDIISLAQLPEIENSFVFVYRKVDGSVVAENSPELASSKRKTDSVDVGLHNKKPKGLGIGAPDGPVSLDDVRMLQRSNEDLRKQLESHVLTIETLQSEARAAASRHETELKELKKSVSLSYADQIKDARSMLEAKQKELDKVSVISAERKNSIDDLNERLAASIQSRTDADGIINSQKTSISELESQLEEERNQRRVEREKAAADLKDALQRARLEAQEEIKRQTDAALRQQSELQEVINKLQESDKESRVVVESLRSKLEDARESLFKSEKKVRQLEAVVHVEQLASAGAQKKVENMEAEIIKLRQELEKEKVAREEVWTKLSTLELEMAAAIRDLAIEKQRFQGARERIILRETQLRAFYSTTEEISTLLAKQQAQIKAMQRTLEDEENCIDNHTSRGNTHEILKNDREASCPKNFAGEASIASTPKNARSLKTTATDSSSTEKYYCGHRNHECGEEETQNEECTSRAHERQGFGSDIDLADTIQDRDDQIGTEQVVGTETQPTVTGLVIQQNASHKNDCVAGETMKVDEELEGRIQVVPLPILSSAAQSLDEEANHEQGESRGSEKHDCLEVLETVEDTQAGSKDDVRMIGTADLLASEPLGSWAASTAPSFHGENDSPCSGEQVAAVAALLAKKDGTLQENLCASQVATSGCLQIKENAKASTGMMDEDTEIQLPAAGSQSGPAEGNAVKISQEYQALSAMIDIVDPGFRKKFQDTEKMDQSQSSDHSTQDYSQSSDDDDGTDEGSGESA